tara:strand:- start:56 stop:1642 length:1587 start_codon:yes stop_codon:yes gene_type:complete
MAKTVDQFSTLENFRTRYNDLASDVGDISGLRTDVTGNLIDAINSIEDKTFFYQEFLYTATASQTAFTGNDAFSNDLVFKKDRIQVYKNGSLLRVGDDYVLASQQSDGTFKQITLISGASSGDKIAIHAFTGSFLTVQGGGVGGSSLFTETANNTIFNHNSNGIILNANNTPSITSLDTGVNIQLEGVTKVDGNLSVDTGHTFTAPTITDGTISITGGNLTNATSITSTAFAGNLTGDVTGDTTGTHIGPLTSSSGNVQVTAATYITEFRGGGSTEGQIKLNCHVNSHGQTIKPQPHSAGVTNTLTLPAGGDQELVGTSATQTLTNKTITGTFTGSLTGTTSDISNHSITGLSDVHGTPSDGQILVYSSSNSRYEPTNQNTSDSVTEGSSNLYFTNERVDDRVNALLVGGTGITTSYDDASNTLTINGNALYGDEDVLDFLGGGGLVGGNGIDLSYDDAANTLTIHSDIEGGSGLLAVTEATGLNTINIGAGKGIKVNTDDVQLDYEVTNSTPGSVGSTPDGHLWFVI